MVLLTHIAWYVYTPTSKPKETHIMLSTTSRETSVPDKKLHIVVGNLFGRYEARCKKLGMSKSEVGRILINAFVKGNIKIEPPTIKQTRTIKPSL